jgi:predicted metal-dependent enzyme (double-stranded beta helix superfamily)
LAERVHDLEARAEMAESNLRTLLASARANGEPQTSTTVSDHEMEAILGVLKGGEDLPVEDDPAQE